MPGLVWLGAKYEFLWIDEMSVVAVIDTPWQLVPDVRQAQYRGPRPGDFMISKAEGTGIIHSVAPGQWGLLLLQSAVAMVWCADRDALVMPWRIVSGDDVIVPIVPECAAAA